MKINEKHLSSLLASTALKDFLEGHSFDHITQDIHKSVYESNIKQTAIFLITQNLRYYRFYQTWLQKFIPKAPQKKYRTTLDGLFCTAISEILWAKTPDNVVLSKYTDIVKNDKKTKHLAGMMRAILGNIVASKTDMMNGVHQNILIYPKKFYETVKKDHPDCYEAILTALLQKPTIGASILQKNMPLLPEVVYHHTTHITLPEHISVANYPHFKDGDITIQSLSSALVLIPLLPQMQGKIVYDLCSAPAGKALQAAAAGGVVTAIDISQSRMQKTHENCERTGLKMTCLVQSALDFKPEALADIVLVDAPCSASGTMRKNPDLLHTIDDKKINDLLHLQKQLLDHGKTLLQKTGILIYATCSLFKKEGEAQITDFLTKNPDIEVFLPDFWTQESSARFAHIQDQMIRILPQFNAEQGGMDGFFIAYLRYCK